MIALSAHVRCLVGVIFSIAAFIPISADEPYIPEELEAWRDWVLYDHPDLACPLDARSGRRLSCAWVSSLAVNVKRQPQPTGAEFRMWIQVYANSEVELPVAGRYQPINVRIRQPSDRQIVVTGAPNKPLVSLNPGRYEISGEFQWSDEPPSIRIPQGTAQTILAIDVEPQARPSIDGNTLWITRRTAEEEDNTLEIRVFRELRDSTPQELSTHIELTVGGFQRVVNLGKVLPAGFTRTSVTSALPTRFDEEDQLSVNLKRGNHWVTIHARATDLLNVFRATPNDHPAWPAQEIWGVLDNTSERTITISGGEPIDLRTAGAPFRRSKGIALKESDTLQLTQQERGDSTVVVGNFSIVRSLWLAFDGHSMISRDIVRSDIDHETRVTADYIPGKIAVNTIPRLVTRADGEQEDNAGVKLTESTSTIDAVSEIEDWQEMSANGWDIDASSLSATLNLPPGWRLLWTTGVDRVTNSWLSQWRLWDMFLVLLLIGLIARTHGLVWAGIAGVTVLLSYQDSATPTVGWLILIAITYLGRVVGSEKLDRWLRPAYWVILVPVAAVSVLFAGISAQQAIFPQLESPRSPSRTTVIPSVQDILYHQASQLEGATEELSSKVRGVGRTAPTSTPQTEGNPTDEVRVTGSFIPRDNFDLPSRTGIGDLGQAVYPTGLSIPTGPGTPSWSWHSVNLHWSGPVTKEQTMSLTLLSPVWSRVLYGFVAVLVLVVTGFFVMLQIRNKSNIARVFKGMSPLLLIAMLVPVEQDVEAQVIHPDILEELEERLVKIPDCLPNCASVEEAQIEIDTDQLMVILRVHVGEELGVPLIQLSDNLQPTSMVVMGNDAPVNTQRGGVLYSVLAEGKHNVGLRVSLTDLLQFDLKFPIQPKTVSVTRKGWAVDGVLDGTLTGDSLEFDRLREEESDTQVVASDWTDVTPVEPYVVVIRNFRLDLVPVVDTKVIRRHPKTGEFKVMIPLLDGESVLTESTQVTEGVVTALFGPGTSEVAWKSQLTLGSELVLTAPPISERSEVWHVKGSDFWDYTTEGIPPIKTSGATESFHPRSRESLTLTFTRPSSIEGQTLTIESAELETTVGTRSYTGKLSLTLEASRGDELNIQLPEGASIKQITRNGREQPTPSGTSIVLSTLPGRSICEVEWTQDASIGMFFDTPQIELSQPARNVELKVKFPENRWTLFLGGPPLGAAVTVWGVIAVILVIAILLSRLSGFPLSTTDAVLLSAGATFANLWALLFVGVWMIGIWWRTNRETPQVSVDVYRLMQLAFIILTVVAIGSLVYTIPVALFGQPEMQIEGYGSTGYSYQWFDDGSAIGFATAWVLSLPKWVYLVVMLAWSLWLVLALVRWIVAAWGALSQTGFWTPTYQSGQSVTTQQDNDAQEPESESEKQ